MSSIHTTKDQLEVVLERIQSRQYFLVVVQHLLSELRNSERRSSYSSCSGMSDPIPSTPPTLPATTVRRSQGINETRADVQTLATLLDDGKKRKRSITHFEGIPLSLIRPEAKAPTDRRVATPRRMRRALERTMAKLCCERSEDTVCHFPFFTAVADDRPTRIAMKTKAMMTTL